MGRKVSKELKKLIGKLPDGWDKMTLEQKIWQVDHKWCLLSTNDMYDLEVSFGLDPIDDIDDKKTVRAFFSIVPDGDHQFTDGGSCFAIPEPASDGQVNLSTFPKYLRGYIKKQAYENWDTDKDYSCMLRSEVEADTFEDAAKEMWFFLDLLTLGYEMTEIEWYMEKHPDLFPEHGDDDDDWDDDEKEDDDVNVEDNGLETIREWDEKSTSFDDKEIKANLPLVLGKYQESQEDAVLDLNSACGVLVAGMDSFSLQELFESIMASLLYFHSQKELLFLFVDTKGDDFYWEYSEPLNCFEKVAGLEQSKETIQWLWNEMQRRYEVLKKAECATLQDYNRSNNDKMPFIVVCVSDLEDWTDFRKNDKDFTRMWMEISRKGRAVGIHFIAATSHPTAEVLPFSVMVNFPVRVALKLPDANQSKIVANRKGAEKLEAYEMYLYDDPFGEAEIVEWQGICHEDIMELIKRYKKA